MYRYVSKENKIVTIDDIRKQYPESSIPDGIDHSDLGFPLLIETQKPPVLPWHTIVESDPINNVQQWVQVPMPAGQIEFICVAGMESMFDKVARDHRYDNRLTCALRAGYAGPYQAEGQAFAIWMDTCNALGYQIMQDVKSGLRPIPSVDELLAELPQMVWPS